MRLPRVCGWIAIEVRRRNLIALQEMPYARPLDTLGTEIVLDSGDYAGLLDKALAAVEWPRLREKLAQRRAAGELVGAGVALFVEKSGLGPFDEVRISVDEQGDGRGGVRLRVGRPRHGDRARADLRRCARRRLPEGAGHPRPNRPHRARHGRIRLARHRHDRRSDADRCDRAQNEGDRGRRRTAAGAGRRARCGRRRGGAHRRRRGSVDRSCRDRPRARPRLEARRRASPRTVGGGLLPPRTT